MRLSRLQQYILLQALLRPAQKINRDIFLNFYKKAGREIKPSMQTKIITRSLERLIDKELMVGYGVRTPHKWFIKEVRLTTKGKVEAKRLLGEQMALPF
ncbi:hypothetical protein HY932_01155 [Candidatus Falkowbacteria bacterium]|nr:hypothetical protein [Candidatus Falkowbacteria bacterium]